MPSDDAFSGLDVMKIERSGSVIQLVVRGDKEKITGYVEAMSPKFFECIDVSLEEAFIYELEVLGYDVKSIEE